MLKALLKIALLAICLLPTLSACSGDEPKTPEDNLPAETKKFVGFWEKGSGYYTTTLELFANGKCLLNGAKGEWAYDRNTKFLSTTGGIQATVTLSTDNAWTGYSPSGEEYNFKKLNQTDLTNYIIIHREELIADHLMQYIATRLGLTVEETLDKFAKERLNYDDQSIIYESDYSIEKFIKTNGYSLTIKYDYIWYLTCSYDYSHHIKGREYTKTYSSNFTIAKGKIISISQTSGGYKVKLSYISLIDNDAYHFENTDINGDAFSAESQTLELNIDPFK